MAKNHATPEQGVMNMKITKIILFFLLPLLLISCFFAEPQEFVISSQRFILGEKGKEFKCNPALTRTRNSASIRFWIKEDWTPEPPWEKIKLNDGRMVSIIVKVNCKSGKVYKANIIGSAGGSVNARFEPEIPKEEEIVNIMLESSSEITVEKVTWCDYDSK